MPKRIFISRDQPLPPPKFGVEYVYRKPHKQGKRKQYSKELRMLAGPYIASAPRKAGRLSKPWTNCHVPQPKRLENTRPEIMAGYDRLVTAPKVPPKAKVQTQRGLDGRPIVRDMTEDIKIIRRATLKPTAKTGPNSAYVVSSVDHRVTVAPRRKR